MVLAEPELALTRLQPESPGGADRPRLAVQPPRQPRLRATACLGAASPLVALARPGDFYRLQVRRPDVQGVWRFVRVDACRLLALEHGVGEVAVDDFLSGLVE